jgi:hypothetical protein
MPSSSKASQGASSLGQSKATACGGILCKRLRIGKLNAKIGRMCIFVACAGACTSGQNASADEEAAHAGCTSKYRQRENFAIVLLGSVALYRKQNRDNESTVAAAALNEDREVTSNETSDAISCFQ